MKILIAEDELVSRRLLTAMLKRCDYEVVAADNGEAAWEILQQEDAPKLAILDWMMPRMDGLEVCRQIRQRSGKTYTYILLLTAKSERGDIIEGLEAGADDYLIKPFDSHELKARLNVGRRILGLHNQLLYLCDELKARATRDGLTGAWNRTTVLEILEHELARAERASSPVGVLLVDFDHFKHVNDTYGHQAGDAVLRDSTQCLRGMLRASDALGRYGGEEFLIILPSCSGSNSVALAERLREEVATSPVIYGDSRIAVTVSIGVTAFEGGGPSSSAALLQLADEALYRAKRSGRNRVEFLAPSATSVPATEILLQTRELITAGNTA